MIPTKFFLKNSLFVMLLFAVTLSSCKKDDDDDDDTTAAFTILKADGSTMANNETFTYSTAGQTSTLNLRVKNNSASDALLMRIKLISMTNADGSFMEVCGGGTCMTGVSVSNLYPNAPIAVASGQTTGINDISFKIADHLGVPTANTYVFQFHEQNTSGTVIGTPVKFTYVYNP
jgi:hypothetical protein